MRMYDIIVKKRNGFSLSKDEIDFFVNGYTEGRIPDYQASALLMAIYFKGMNEQETADLTMAMAHSGDVLDLKRIEGVKVDKHSTGGVGDKTSLVLGPMVACLGIPVAKMSGRGLGHTGGTIDKLESFPGFITGLSEEQFIKNVNSIKIAIAGQTGNLAPADKKLYALRDVTGTVENISLIASSIMSKKIASGADVIVLDVKTGSGAFMKTQEDSIKLAKEMVKIGTNVGRKTIAVISDMDEPLGLAVGNSLEVKEAIDTLAGHGPKDLFDLCLTLGKYMVIGAGITSDEAEAEKMLRETITSGKALEKMAAWVKAQNGNPEAVYNTDLLPKASEKLEVVAPVDGYISSIKSDDVGLCSMMLGGGRETKESTIDLAVGIVLNKKVGDYVKKNDTLAVIHANDVTRLEEVKNKLLGTFTFSERPIDPIKLIKCVIREEDIH